MALRALFNHKVLTHAVDRHIAEYGLPAVHQVDVVRRWSEELTNGNLRLYTETQIEQAFNSAIFAELLQYKPIGAGARHHLIPKKSMQGGHTPDFVLGSFEPAKRIERWRAVGEIKAPATDLDLPQSSRTNHESPVEQAFRYALHGSPGIEWVIVTNFGEIRLYRNGYVDAFHSWQLAELTDPRRLAEFIFLLRQENLAPDFGESESLQVLTDSFSAGAALTDGFYGLYDIARQRLIAHLVKAPSMAELPAPVIFGKAHKILNRVLFAAFCEDHPAELLPKRTLERIHTTAARHTQKKNAYWRAFRKLFDELDKGSPPGATFAFNAFNGGLFARDALIDKVDLPDGLFTEDIAYKSGRKQSRTIKGVFGFHAYDFAEELDVDALGAIFEQSLADLPHLALPTRGKGSIPSTRRETGGVYYTPRSITRYLTNRALQYILAPLREQTRGNVEQIRTRSSRLSSGRMRRSGAPSKLSASDTKDVRYHRQMLELLQDIAVYDPACGSGAFLIEALSLLHSEYERVGAALGQLVGAAPILALDRKIVRKNIYGSDILPESAEIARLSIWLRTAKKNERLEKLDETIRAQDSLRVCEPERFDVVLGNPPWGAELPGWSKEEVAAAFPSAGKEQDSYALFVIKAFELLKPQGVLAFIVPNSWLTTDGYESFRRWFLSRFELLELVHVWKIFKAVNHDACLILARKTIPRPCYAATVRSLAKRTSEVVKEQHLAEHAWSAEFAVEPLTWLNRPRARFETIYPTDISNELDRVGKGCTRLDDVCDVTVGIQVYHRRKVTADIIRRRAFHSRTKEGHDWHPFIDGNEVQRYFAVPSTQAFLRYSDKLCDKRELDHYSKSRILVQQIFWNRLCCAIQSPTDTYLYLNTIFAITSRNSSADRSLELEYVLGILNSRFLSAAYEHWANRIFGDKFPKVSKGDLASLPLPIAPLEVQREIAALSTQLGQRWSALKASVTSFRDLLRSASSRRPLSTNLERFWLISKMELVSWISGGAENDQFDNPAHVIAAWRAATSDVNEAWSQIVDTERALDELVQRAYGIKPEIYERMLSRVPTPDLADVLLPRERAGAIPSARIAQSKSALKPGLAKTKGSRRGAASGGPSRTRGHSA